MNVTVTKYQYSSPMASLVLTESSQLTADGFEKLPDQIMYPYAEPYDLQKNMCLAAVTSDSQNLERVYPHLREGIVENYVEITTLITPDRDSNLDLPVIGSPVYCESSALDHVATKAVWCDVLLERGKGSSASFGWQACTAAVPGMLNVHLIPHSHDDVGWLKTVDQYYYGKFDGIQRAGVQYIIDSVVRELAQKPERRFIQVETAFFWKWWDEQDEDTRDLYKSLVNSGQIEMVGGGWSMNDEAASHYHSTIENFALGLRRLNDTFGSCGRPHAGWQIDPFGHSRETASIMAQMGYDGLFFSRLDYDDKTNRIDTRTMELVWEASANLGSSADLFTGVHYNHYSNPSGFCFDINCGDDPFIDNKRSPDYNVDEKVQQFILFVNNQLKAYTTENIILTMGDDFNYQNAHMNFKNMDKLIGYVNALQANGSNINVFYSTPSCYLKALHDANQTWSVKEDDFFPYASEPYSYWTGYFTSRPTQKRFERTGNNLLQSCLLLNISKCDETELAEDFLVTIYNPISHSVSQYVRLPVSGDSYTVTDSNGVLVEEVHQVLNDWVSQVIRVYKGETHVEFEWLVGPIPISDNVSKEPITRFTTNLESEELFYTDSNGRELLERRRDYRPTWTAKLTEPVSGNYYPVTSKILIRDQNKGLELAVLNDRSQGGSSMKDGQVEIMVHRRLLSDDAKGVGEALNEIAYGEGLIARGRHFVFAGEIAGSNNVSLAAQERLLAQRILLAPWVFISQGSSDQTRSVNRKQFVGLTNSLPENVQVLTLERWTDNSLLLRLEHILEKDEDKVLSQDVSINIQRGGGWGWGWSPQRAKRVSFSKVDTFLLYLFCIIRAITVFILNSTSYLIYIESRTYLIIKNLLSPLTVNSLRETTLDGNQWLSDTVRLAWTSTDTRQRSEVSHDIQDFSVTLSPMQIRTFVVETAFFWKWWVEQDEDTRDLYRSMVNSGQIEMIGGGWSMNDEAATHYHSTIDNFAWGLRRLDEAFGACGRPRVGWQIDPFGHSRETASIMAQMGYDGLLFARLDYQDMVARVNTSTMEMVWEASANLGSSADLFTSIMYSFYGSPSGFCFDVGCNDEPIIDNVHSAEYNVDNRFLPRYVNALQANGSRVNVLYSTPSCYLKGLNDAKQTWSTKEDDFFPYGSSPNDYWTGYFTSRPTIKRFERVGNNFLQVCKQLSVLGNVSGEDNLSKLDDMRDAMGIMQHHDAVTGTEKQASCLLLNISLCEETERSEDFLVTIYNPISHPVSQYVRLPVSGDSYIVTDSDGDLVEEIHQVFSDWTSQVIRVYKEESHVEFEWLVGPIPINYSGQTNLYFILDSDNKGKEPISQFTTSFATDKIFYTDSNGREMLRRERNHRPTWDVKLAEPAPGNYYPVTSKIVVHRRLLNDDAKGVDEALNEIAYGEGLIARGRHFVFAGEIAGSNNVSLAAQERLLAQRILLAPWVFISRGSSDQTRSVNRKQSCTDTVPGMLNVHLIPHSHDDLGYRKTVDQYYYGSKFVQVETAFLWMWWQEQDEASRNIYRNLINSGQIELIGGGWVMNDEADSHYQATIDQFTWGLRLDYQDKEARLNTSTMEMVWEASESLGSSSDLFTSVLYNHYSYPTGFCVDVNCDDDPIIDNPDSPDYNLETKVQQFISFVKEQAKSFTTDHIIVTMGQDFNYQDASMNYKNIDKLIRHVNALQMNGNDVNVMYSTPSCYLKAIHDANRTWTTKTDDFFPYGSDAHSYWTGYFTSRPTHKGFERMANNFLQVCKQLSVLGNVTGSDADGKLDDLRRAMGIMQHHDAITGTERQEVADDYIRMLTAALRGCEDVTKAAINNLVGNSSNLELKSCLLLNISLCEETESSEDFLVTIYNPISHPVSQYVRLPVSGDSYIVTDYNGKLTSVTRCPST
uniref:alpha-mannosidase n=1 Tax=Timema bartmani TaxID=61472 RepID=A0A7R9F456_9NEOP|nr:unnamed protein product [Timema bartmani]